MSYHRLGIHWRLRLRRMTPLQRRLLGIIPFLVVILAFSVMVSSYMRAIVTDMAISQAIDVVTLRVNNIINQKMSNGDYDYSNLVTLEKDSEGVITAITTNMARINMLSADILKEVVGDSSPFTLEVGVPLGNILGSDFLQGRGPNIPVKIVMLTSSFAEFSSEFSAAGINQTKHQIVLELLVKINVHVPWGAVNTEVVSDVLIAETIIVGQVPQAYLNQEKD